MATAQQPAAATAPLRVERRFAASPERLFAAWSTAEGLSRWSAPGDARPSAEVDLRVGGRYRITMEGPDGTRHVVGKHAHGWDGCLDKLTALGADA